MSRFFEALKQAGQSFPLPGDAGSSTEAEAPKSTTPARDAGSGLDLELHAQFQAAFPPETNEAPAASLQQSAVLETEPAILAQAEPAVTAPSVPEITPDDIKPALAQPPLSENGNHTNGHFGRSVAAHLNKTARLIPNADGSIVVEHYRSLRTKLMQARAEKTFRSVLISSAGPKEGKTVTLLNLALTFAMLPSFKILAIDGDLRKGSMSEWVGVDDQPGLGELIEGTIPLEQAILKSSEIPFSFMSRGNSKLSPPELLHSNRWPARMKEIQQHFDLVLVDSPPVGLVTDARLLAAGCDAVLLIARAFLTSSKSVEKMCEEFAKCRTLGVVLNAGDTAGRYRGYNSYYGGKRKNG